MLYTSISLPNLRFLCGKKFPSFSKEKKFLPQRRKKYSAKRWFFVRKDENRWAWNGFWRLDEVDFPTKTG